jgi:CcmD family protein
MRIFNKITLLLTTLFFSVGIFAQDKTARSSDLMRSNGRIYVVVAVMLTILIGLVLYLVRLERQISKLEKEN